MSDETRTEGKIDEVKGNIKEGIGKLTGNERTEAEGKTDQAKGSVKQGAADLKDKADNAIDKLTNR